MYSAIVFLETQYDDFPQFLFKLDRIFSNMEIPYELIVIANGTGNFFRSVQDRFFILGNRMRAFEFGAPVAPAVCLKAVINEARGDILAIFGSYQQLTDDSIEKCIKAMADPEIEIISPWRQNRVDPAFNQMQSRVFNWLARRFAGTDLHDFSCTVKVCKRQVLQEIDLYGNMFRFFPVLAAARGFAVHELPVNHHEERGRKGFYKPAAYAGRILDIFTLFFNTRFSRKPLRFFSALGMAFVVAGLLLMAFVFGQRIFSGIPIGNRPALFAALLIMILGVLVSSAGLLGEIIAFTNGRHKKEYVIEKVI
ncbi:MAG: hypothetical protein K9K82_00685 [Desulfobacteraceae bacterium]|nr:hypothetical protein [Desulfobacteraceae bacterium]